MTEVHYLNLPHNTIVLTLEDLLRRARAGEFSGLAVSATHKNGDVSRALVIDDDVDVLSLVGSLEALKIRLVLTQVEGER